MDYFGKYNGYDVFRGGEMIFDVPQICLTMGQIKPSLFACYRLPENAEQEERGLAQQSIETASLVFEDNRIKVEKALQGIAGSVFDRYDLPRSNGIDIGSGATGAMVHQFLAPHISASSWSEMDVNPIAVKENKHRHPQARVLTGSYLHLDRVSALPKQVDIVTGLSSLDATHFISQALGQIRQKLHIGGFLLHIQDVRPGMGTPIRELEHMGLQSPFSAYMLKSNVGTQQPLAYQTPEGLLSVGELFRRNLGRLIEQQYGMQLLVNDWFFARRMTPNLDLGGSAYHMNVHLRGISLPIDEVSAVVTLAQKVA